MYVNEIKTRNIFRLGFQMNVSTCCRSNQGLTLYIAHLSATMGRCDPGRRIKLTDFFSNIKFEITGSESLLQLSRD